MSGIPSVSEKSSLSGCRFYGKSRKHIGFRLFMVLSQVCIRHRLFPALQNCNSYIFPSCKKRGDFSSPRIVDAPHLGYRWRNTCCNASHLCLGGETPAENLSVHLYYIQNRGKMQPHFLRKGDKLAQSTHICITVQYHARDQPWFFSSPNTKQTIKQY